MNKSDAIKIDLNGYKNQLDIIEQVIQQINKDLDMNISINKKLIGDALYQQLIIKIHPKIDAFLKKGNSLIEQLLYKIDISENELALALKEQQKTEPSRIITHLIVERELQKIVCRMLYSKGLL